MHIYISYINLLGDISSVTGVPIRDTADLGLEWAINMAPLLDKQMLRYLESGTDFESDWPRGLRLLRDKFIETDNPLYLGCLRNACLFCYKALHTSNEHQISLACEKFRNTNELVGCWSMPSDGKVRRILNYARLLVRNVVRDIEPEQFKFGHGPGAVFPKPYGKGKWQCWYSEIDKVIPYGTNYWLQSELDDIRPELPIVDSIFCNMVAVPKDARGPRLICVHPAEAVWAQQGVRTALESAITSGRGGYLIRPNRFIRFTDQTVNGRLALESSKTRELATIDLSEASDRVSYELVDFLFGDFSRFLMCSRAGFVRFDSVDGHKPVPLGCFAPMGNALTFPVESLTFWSLCVATLIIEGCNSPNCYVFGDDLIVPTAHAESICNTLVQCGFKVNDTKSFLHGYFRESCGIDAYKGHSVTPLRWKLPYNLTSPEHIVSACNLAQRARLLGFNDMAITLYSICSKILRNKYKVSLPRTSNWFHGGIAEWTPGCPHPTKWNDDIHTWESRILTTRSKVVHQRPEWFHVRDQLARLDHSSETYATPNGFASVTEVPVRGTSIVRTHVPEFIPNQRIAEHAFAAKSRCEHTVF